MIPHELRPKDLPECAIKRRDRPGLIKQISATVTLFFLLGVVAAVVYWLVHLSELSYLIWLLDLSLPVGLVLINTRRFRRPRRLRKRLRKLGFTPCGESNLDRPEGPHRLRIELTGGRSKTQAISLWLEPAPQWQVAQISAESFWRGRFALGDLRFDKRVVISGPEDQARALLDAPTRHQLAEVVATYGATWLEGRLTVPLLSVPWMSRAQLTEHLNGWIGLVLRLVMPADHIQDRLRAVALSDTEPGPVRAGAWAQLEPSGRQETASALLEARLPTLSLCLSELNTELDEPLKEPLTTELRDALLAVLDAQISLPWLEALTLEERRDAYLRVRARVFVTLTSGLPFAQWPEVLCPLLSHPRADVRANALAKLMEIAHPLTASQLAALHADDAPEVRQRLVSWYASQPPHFAEAGLIDLLRSCIEVDPSLAAFERAATHLGAVGGLKSIGALLPFEETHRTRRVTRLALNALRARLPEGAAAGGLAVVQDEQLGGLAVVSAGELALVGEREAP